MELIGYIAAFLMGATVGLMGGGGSVLTVPILVYLFKVDPIDATAASLFVVGMTSLFAALQHAKTQPINLKTVLSFAAPSLIGVFLARSVVLPSIPNEIALPFDIVVEKGNLVLGTFAALMITASISMIRSGPISQARSLHPAILTVAIGVAVGFATGFVGAGGGFIILPALVHILGVPLRTAIGTSLAIIAINSLFGFIASLLANIKVDWQLQILILLIALLGSAIGTRFSSRMNESTIRRLFGWLVLIIGIAILAERLAQTI